jgi:hypothetical protein
VSDINPTRGHFVQSHKSSEGDTVIQLDRGDMKLRVRVVAFSQ